MSELPEGWAECSLEDLLGPLSDGKILHQGWSPQCESTPAPEGEWGVLKTTAVQDGYFLEDENKALPSALSPKPELEVKAGDLLMTCAGPRSRCGVICHVPKTREKLIFSGKIYRFRPNAEHVEPKFLTHLLRTAELKEKIDEIKTGISESGMNMTRERFFALPVRLAPLAEQTRIAAKLDELLAQVDTLKARIDGIPLLLKRFRQSVLAAAVSGRLTEEWRTENSGCDVAEQINTILSDRLLFSKSKKVPATHLKNEEYEIPKTWRWVSLDSLSAKIVDGTHHTPTYVESGVPFISVKDIRNGVIDFSSTKFISTEEHVELCKRCRPQKGDLLITKSGTIGRTALINTEAEFSLFVSVALIKPASKFVNMKFIDIALMKWVNEIDISSRIVGSAIKNLHLTDMKVLAIPFAPLEEQTEIVRRVEQLFAFADQLEAKIASAKSRIDHLTQSILAKAFRGELVPQDPNDEPASVLLERIKTQRAAAPKAKRGRKAST